MGPRSSSLLRIIVKGGRERQRDNSAARIEFSVQCVISAPNHQFSSILKQIMSVHLYFKKN